jgi:hypothetical protein
MEIVNTFLGMCLVSAPRAHLMQALELDPAHLIAFTDRFDLST